MNVFKAWKKCDYFEELFFSVRGDRILTGGRFGPEAPWKGL